MNEGQVYALIAGISFFQLFLILNRAVVTKYKETLDHRFTGLIVCFMLFCLVDALWGIFDAGYSFVNRPMFSAITYAYNIFVAFTAYMWFSYVFSYMNPEHEVTRPAAIFSTSLLFIQLSMIVVNFFTKGGFYITENLTYIAGWMRLPMYAAQFLYYVVILVYTAVNYLLASEEDQKTYRNVFIFTMVPLIFGIGQFIFYNVALYSMGFMLSAFIIYAFNITDIRERHLAKMAEESNRYAMVDVLTDLLNRRAYEEDMSHFSDKELDVDFVYVSMDLNELKKTNDECGHEAGDELLQGAAGCMKRCFGSFGRVYRTGGDEFAAIITAAPDKLETIKKDFEETLASWRGVRVSEIHISKGIVARRETSGKTLAEMTHLADDRMYRDKALYYSNKGIDRRGQAEAFSALCSLYKKILKINLQKDIFQIITMDLSEKNEEFGFSDTISAWFKNFALSGNVHKDDIESFLNLTNLDFLKEYFHSGKSILSIPYRRKEGSIYRKTVMEMIPASSYTDKSQTIYLYVKFQD